jgi:hypothetical protein
VLAERYGDDRLVGVGRALDDATFGPGPADDDRRAEVDAVLTELADRPAPDREREAALAGGG